MDDANLLFQNERYARAYVLAQLAGEELSKAVLVLARLLAFRFAGLNPPDRDFWKWWRDHTDKGSFLKSWQDMFGEVKLAQWMELPADAAKESIIEAIPLVSRRWGEAQAHSKSNVGLREDATYVDFRESKVITPATSVGAADAQSKILEVSVFMEFVTPIPLPDESTFENLDLAEWVTDTLSRIFVLAEGLAGTPDANSVSASHSNVDSG